MSTIDGQISLFETGPKDTIELPVEATEAGSVVTEKVPDPLDIYDESDRLASQGSYRLARRRRGIPEGDEEKQPLPLASYVRPDFMNKAEEPNEPDGAEVAPPVELEPAEKARLLLRALGKYAEYRDTLSSAADRNASRAEGDREFFEAEGLDAISSAEDPVWAKIKAVELARQFRDRYIPVDGDFAPELATKARKRFEETLRGHLKPEDKK